MKTLSLSALLLLPTLAASPVLAQTKPAAKTTTTKTSSTAKPTATAARPATKPATAAKPAAKPVAVAQPAAEPTPAAPASTATPKAAPKATSSATGFVKGSTAVNLGIGLGLGYGYLGNASMPALNLSVERGFIEGVGPGTIGIGGLVGYKSYRYDYPGTKYKATWTNMYVGVRGTYHYNFTDNPKVDTYAGISLGARIESYKNTYVDDVLGKDYYDNYGGAYMYSGFFLGGRYYFTDNIGAFGEIGYDASYLKLGLSAKF
ncbi:hypothetical protein [Hymenobacter sp. B81]|uniref:hypothetical protein n=1 Tax=Hymenobacter sp. B81 TaxID=3344878 RepID=UPI0037DCB3E8